MSHHCCLWLLALGTVASSAMGAEPTRAELDFFEQKIRPVLVTHCYECHSAKAVAEKKLKGKLLLDTREGTLAGGESGPAVVPGKPAESLIVSALKYDGFEMPPKKQLPESIVADFEKWIASGAADPRDGSAPAVATETIDIEAGRKHWAFQPLADVEPPVVDDARWSRNPIDKFVRRRQVERGLAPVDRASAETLIRRLHYDLVGLPPAPERVEKFVNDAERDFEPAYVELVDELLASERHGERWARHWLDVVRFAESNGYAFDKDRPNAYRYRDFVIRALNSDMPYDEFVRLQIAGDLLTDLAVNTTAESEAALERVAATGFVVAGPFTTQQTQKERERSRYEQLDDIVHTLGTSMLGLTIGCCRCHDHKYDPLPSHDYYRLAACFADVGFSDTSVVTNPEEYHAAKAAYDAAHAPLVAARSEYEKKELVAAFDKWLAERPTSEPPKSAEAVTFSNWQHVGPFPAADFNGAFAEAFPPEKSVDLAAKYAEGKLAWKEQADWKDGVVHNTLTGENAANYLFRVVESPTEQRLALSLGSDDAIKVWVNGEQVLANLVGRGAEADQEKVEVPLKKGRNELLLKIVNGAGPSGFYFKANPTTNVEIEGFADWQHIGPFMAKDLNVAYDTSFGPETKVDLAQTFDEGKLKWTARPEWIDGQVHAKATSGDENAAHYLFREIVLEQPLAVNLSLGSDDAVRLWLNGREMLAKKATRNGPAAGQEKVTLKLPAGRSELLMKIVNAKGESGFYFAATTAETPKDVAAILALDTENWNAGQRNKVVQWYRDFDRTWVELNDAVVQHDKQLPKPTTAAAYAAKTRGGTYNFGGNTYNVFHLRRGNADNKEDEAKPGFLQVLKDEKVPETFWLSTSDGKPGNAPRIGLAEWLTNTEKGAGELLARVIVNRLWQHHFGRGIVATSSDFGTRGELPTHPELLDFLAAELIRGGWKLKPIHRLIVTSEAYRLAVDDNGANRKIDPDNQWRWRREPRRLEAEAIRDALLAVAGDLDTTPFGKGSLDANSRRRSVYLTVKRSRLIPFLQLFDAPGTMQGVGQREESTVSPQALAMVNSPFVRGLATKFALRVRPNGETSVEDGLRSAYRVAFSREPASEEIEAMAAFVSSQSELRGGDANAETLAFRDACHLLLCANEFTYVD